MQYCGKCGAKLKADDAFCPQCGTPVKSSEPSRLNQQAKPSHKGIWIGVAIAVVVVLGLAWWFFMKASNDSTMATMSSSSSSSQTSQTSSSSSNTSSSASSSSLWNSTKDQELESFINSWAPKMGQSYVKYDGTNSIKSAPGCIYPDDFDKAYFQSTPARGAGTGTETKISMGWAPTGAGPYDYNVVAIYNYNSGKLVGRITYAFCIHNGQPVALVNQTTNGNDVWSVTRNQDVSSNFEKIFNEK